MQSKLGRDVLEKIKEEKIKPKPKWFFITKNFSLWFFFQCFCFVGKYRCFFNNFHVKK